MLKPEPMATKGDIVLLGIGILLGFFIPGAIGLNYSAMIVGGVLAFVGGLYIIGTIVTNRKNGK